jgi:hypothetical protein
MLFFEYRETHIKLHSGIANLLTRSDSEVHWIFGEIFEECMIQIVNTAEFGVHVSLFAHNRTELECYIFSASSLS